MEELSAPAAVVFRYQVAHVLEADVSVRVRGIPSRSGTALSSARLNPRLYLEWLLPELPNAGKLTDEVLDNFLP